VIIVRCDAEGCAAEARVSRKGDTGRGPLPTGWYPSVFYPAGHDRTRRSKGQPWEMRHYCPQHAAARKRELARAS